MAQHESYGHAGNHGNLNPNGTAWRWTKPIRNKPTTCGKLLLLHLSSRNDCNVTHDPLPLNWARGKLWGSVPCFGHVQTYRFEVKPTAYTAPRAKSSIVFNVNHPSKSNNLCALVWSLQLFVSHHQTKPCHQIMPAPKPPGPEPVRCRKTGPGLGAWIFKLRPVILLNGQIQVCNFQRLRSHCHRLPGGDNTALRPHWITLWSTKDHWCT